MLLAVFGTIPHGAIPGAQGNPQALRAASNTQALLLLPSLFSASLRALGGWAYRSNAPPPPSRSLARLLAPSLSCLLESARFPRSGVERDLQGSKPGRPAAATFHKYGHVDGSEAKDNQPCASERHGRAVDAVQIGIHRG